MVSTSLQVWGQIAFMISLMCCFALSLICWSSSFLPNSPRLRSTMSKSLSMSCRSPVSSVRIFPCPSLIWIMDWFKPNKISREKIARFGCISGNKVILHGNVGGSCMLPPTFQNPIHKSLECGGSIVLRSQLIRPLWIYS